MSEPAEARVARRDKNGQPLGLMEWATLYEDDDYRLVAETEVDGVLVRTLWEGHDVQVMGAGDMFHTGVRRGDRWRDEWVGHHPCTLVEAEAAHEIIVAMVREQEANRAVDEYATQLDGQIAELERGQEPDDEN